MKQPVALTLRLNPEIYNKTRKIARLEGKSFTNFVNTLLEDRLKREEKKALFNAFSTVAEDKEESDVDFALKAQREVALKHE